MQRCTYLDDGDRLDSAGVGNMGSETQIDEGATFVDGGRRSIGDLGVNVVLLEFVVLQGAKSARLDPLHEPAPTSNIFIKTSLGSSKRSKGCFSLTAILQTSSIPL
jgi:hypothetical protein